MIGNDIVDLNQAAKDSPDSDREGIRFKRFLDKAFTFKEQQRILKAEDESSMVWLLWSMKEAAYKIYVQQFGKRFFNPKRLACQLLSETEGVVTIDKQIYQTTSRIGKDYIHTIAYTSQMNEMKSSCFKTEDTSYEFQSHLSRKVVIENYSKIKNTDTHSITIEKDILGVPHFFQNSVKQNEALSLSHHGNYCGYAILRF